MNNDIALFDDDILADSQSPTNVKTEPIICRDTEALAVLSNATAIIFDLETGPLPVEQLVDVIEPFDESSIRHPGDFDPANVKLGNVKDQSIKDEKIEKARVAHATLVANYPNAVEFARKAHVEKFLSKAALSAFSAQILMANFALVIDDEYQIQLHADFDGNGTVDEAELLRRTWDFISHAIRSRIPIIGHNIIGFDLPLAIRRSWILGVGSQITPGILDKRRYWNDAFVDIMQVWGCGEYKAFYSLDRIAKALGAGEKNGDGSEFAAMWAVNKPAAIEYARNDLRMIGNCAKKMNLVV